jgi:hypothetical protein
LRRRNSIGQFTQPETPHTSRAIAYGMAGQSAGAGKIKYTAAGKAQEFGSDISINESFDVIHRRILRIHS